MNPFKRIVVSINASLDQFITQVENHEAIAMVAIRDVEKAAGQARFQLNRLRNNNQKSRKRLAELELEQKQWIVRAREIHSTNEKDALECVRRLKFCERESLSIRAQLDTQEKIEQQLAEDVRSIDEKLNILRSRKNTLSAQQAQAEAVAAVKSADGCADGSVEGIFEMWEQKIALSGSFKSSDSRDEFESRFVSKEKEDELRSELNRILK